MIKSLLIGIQSNPPGGTALELGLRWALRYDALLVGLGVVDEPGVHTTEEVLVGEGFFRKLNETMVQETRHRVDDALESFVSRCRQAGARHKIIEDVGTPYLQFLREAQRYDLILLERQTHFRFGFENTGDDTLTKVLSASPRPVVAVPEALPPEEVDAVLLAYDGSLQASRSLAQFQASGLGNGRKLHVVCAREDAKIAVQEIGRALEFLNLHSLEAHTHILSEKKPPAEQILAKAKELHAGLLVMGAYGQTRLREFLLGSQTRAILNTSDLPIFLYH